MITRIVTLYIDQNKINSFLTFFKEYKQKIASQKGCTGVELMTDIHDQSVVYTISEWISEEALNEYRQSKLFGEIWPIAKSHFRSKPHAVSLKKV